MGDITVAAEHEYAFYTRWPSHRENGWPAEAEDLICPKCGDDRIVILAEATPHPKNVNVLVPIADGMLGDTAQCWTCKYKFIVTANCWKWRRIK